MRRSSSWIAVLPSLVIPVCIGLMMYLGLSYLINQGTISNELVLRYLTGHPVSEVTIGMFFVGIASLGLIAKNIFEQFGAERKITLNFDAEGAELDQDSSPDREVAGKAIALGNRLQELPDWIHEHYLWQRLVSVLHSIHRTNSTTTVEDELKYLADLDLDRQQQRYSLVRILIWATPMLGFLGTVLGISQALGGINVGPDNNFQQMMDGLRGSLYVAFDTTALALTLSMILMFGQFLIERFESQLLVLVDQRSKAEIGLEFDMSVSDKGGQEDVASQIIDASRESAKKQTEIWRKSIRAAEQAWISSLTEVNTQVQGGLSDALDENVSNLAHYLGEAIDRADTAMTHRWEQWQVTLSDNARLMESQQKQLCEQTDLVHQLLSENKTRKNDLTSPAESGPKHTVDPSAQPIDESGAANIADAPTSDHPTSHELLAVELSELTREPESTASDHDSNGRLATIGDFNPETIRFENYFHQSTNKSRSTPEREMDAEVILPFRPVARRAEQQDSVNYPSKKSA